MSLVFGHLGSGISVWRKGQDNMVAHISAYRNIQYYYEVTEEEKAEIEKVSRTDDRNISSTQNSKVFRFRPSKK